MPLVLTPVILLAPRKLRYGVLLGIIAVMLGTAIYNLTGLDLGTFYVFKGEGAISLYFDGTHPYSDIAAFGFVLVGAMALLYGLQTAKAGEQAAALCAIASAVGIVYSGNFIALFIFWELLTITTALLILLHRTETALHMGKRFLLFHLTGGLVLLLGILQHYAAAGSLDLAHPEAGMVFFVIGIGAKAAFLPIHLWVAWGYPNASFPSSVVLAGLTTKIGIFAIARLIPVEVWQGNLNFIIGFIGASMAIFGFTCALLQKDMRKLLSYHIISQVGYMVAGAGMGVVAANTSYAIDGSLLHMVNHMLYKALLLMCAGAVLYTTGTENLHDLHHGDTQNPPIWKSLPVITGGALVGALAISGVPPFNGYVSKYFLKYAVEGVQPMDTMLLIASVGTAISFCKLLYFGYFRAWAKVERKLPASATASIVVVSFLCILLGVNPHLLSNIIPEGTTLDVYNQAGIVGALQLVVIGIMVFVLLSNILERGIKPPAWMSIESLVFVPVGNYAYKLLCAFGYYLDSSVNNSYIRSSDWFYRFCQFIGKVDTSLDEMYSKGGQAAYKFAEKSKSLDGSLDRMYSKGGQAAYKFAEKSKSLDGAIDSTFSSSGSAVYRLADKVKSTDEALDDALENSGRSVTELAKSGRYIDDALNRSYEKTGEKAREALEHQATSQQQGWGSFQWTIKNLNFDNLLLVAVLGFLLVILFYFGG